MNAEIKIRNAKIFTGTKKIASYKTELQYHNGESWVPVQDQWATEEDERKYKKAVDFEMLHGCIR